MRKEEHFEKFIVTIQISRKLKQICLSFIKIFRHSVISVSKYDWPFIEKCEAKRNVTSHSALKLLAEIMPDRNKVLLKITGSSSLTLNC